MCNAQLELLHAHRCRAGDAAGAAAASQVLFSRLSAPLAKLSAFSLSLKHTQIHTL
jgi:hypothetical protein